MPAAYAVMMICRGCRSACALLLCVAATASAQAPRAVEHIPASAIRTAASGPATMPGGRIDILRRGPEYLHVLVWREESGEVEVHRQADDVFIVQQGQGTLLHGGAHTGGQQDPELPPGEIRGGTITGGTRQSLTAGDIVTIPAGVPHQVLLEPGAERLVYMVIKPYRP